MKIQVLVDNPKSWIVPYATQLCEQIAHKATSVTLLHEHDAVTAGDILLLLSCEKIFKDLSLNTFNLVVHESYLPKGKGWSPLTWQILEGQNNIPVTLFEAKPDVDAGEIYFQEIIELNGSELVDELRVAQGNATIRVFEQFLNKYPNITGRPQSGESSFYPRRKAADSQLDVNLSIKEQFNLLRVVDNDRYPAFFELFNKKYKITITNFEDND